MLDAPTVAGNPEADATDLVDVVDEIETLAAESGDLVVQDLLDHYDGRAYGLWILVPALIALSPAGAVPSVPSIVAVTLILITVQALVGREKPWLPGWVRRRHISDTMIDRLTRFSRPLARGTDWILRPRLTRLASGPAQYPIAIAVVLLAALMIPLELLPMAGFFPAAAIVLLALGLTAKDGVLDPRRHRSGMRGTISTMVVFICDWIV